MALEQQVVGRHRADTDERTTRRRRQRADAAAPTSARHRDPAPWIGDDEQTEHVGAALASLVPRGVRLLHDRRVPGSRANLDHVAVTGSAVWVVTAERVGGRPRPTTAGGRLRPRSEHLQVGLRDRTRLVEHALAQAERVAQVLADDVPVRPALCLVEADWPLLGSDFTVRDVLVTWPRRLAAVVDEGRDGPLDVAAVHQRLNAAFRVF